MTVPDDALRRLRAGFCGLDTSAVVRRCRDEHNRAYDASDAADSPRVSTRGDTLDLLCPPAARRNSATIFRRAYNAADDEDDPLGCANDVEVGVYVSPKTARRRAGARRLCHAECLVQRDACSHSHECRARARPHQQVPHATRRTPRTTYTRSTPRPRVGGAGVPVIERAVRASRPRTAPPWERPTAETCTAEIGSCFSVEGARGVGARAARATCGGPRRRDDVGGGAPRLSVLHPPARGGNSEPATPATPLGSDRTLCARRADAVEHAPTRGADRGSGARNAQGRVVAHASGSRNIYARASASFDVCWTI